MSSYNSAYAVCYPFVSCDGTADRRAVFLKQKIVISLSAPTCGRITVKNETTHINKWFWYESVAECNTNGASRGEKT